MISSIVKTLLISIVPTVEMRGSIPVAITIYKMNPFIASILGILGSFAPAPLILWFLPKLFPYLEKINILSKFIKYLERRSLQKGKKIEKYGLIFLAIFVAIPLPGSGAWTGTLIALFMGLPYKDSLIAIFFGLILSAVIVTLATLGILNIF